MKQEDRVTSKVNPRTEFDYRVRNKGESTQRIPKYLQERR